VVEKEKERERETHQWDDDLAVGGGLELVVLEEGLTQGLVVVDLAVDGEGDGAGLVVERLGTAHRVHDTETLVAQHALVVHIDAVPVRATMANSVRD
jgi:hypothetical protein